MQHAHKVLHLYKLLSENSDLDFQIYEPFGDLDLFMDFKSQYIVCDEPNTNSTVLLFDPLTNNRPKSVQYFIGDLRFKILNDTLYIHEFGSTNTNVNKAIKLSDDDALFQLSVLYDILPLIEYLKLNIISELYYHPEFEKILGTEIIPYVESAIRLKREQSCLNYKN